MNHLKAEFGENTETIVADLSIKEDVFKIYNFCKDKNIDLLINNAGYGLFGTFDAIDLNDEVNMINVNITALHILTKLFLRDFKKKNKGYILNVASVAGFLTGPLMSSYYASKNYVLKLSLGIAEELRREKSNVKITTLCPGPVKTNFNNRAGVSFSAKPISPEFVAEYALNCVFKGKLLAVPGITIKLAAIGQRFVPYKLLSAIVYNVQHAKDVSEDIIS